MAKEIQTAYSATGVTLYANVSNGVGLFWNGTTFVAESGLAAGLAAVTLNEGVNAKYAYFGDFPAGIVAPGVYTVWVRLRAGGVPAWTDPVVGIGSIEWTGSAVLTPARAGDAMDLVTPAETAGRPTALTGMMRRLFEGRHNKRTRDRLTGVLAVRNAADTGDLETQTQSTVGTTDTQTAGV